MLYGREMGLSRWRRFLCRIGRHLWRGHTHDDYPTPFCHYCDACHDPKKFLREIALGFHSGESYKWCKFRRKYPELAATVDHTHLQ